MKPEQNNSTSNSPSQDHKDSIAQPDKSIDQTIHKNEENLNLTNSPELPPSETNSYPRIITEIASQSNPSNQKLVKFFLNLSNLVFFGGSMAGLLVLIYQKYFFPKLEIRTEILRLLRVSTLKSYEKISTSLNELVQSNSNLYKSSLLNIANKSSSNYSTEHQALKEPNPDFIQRVEQAKMELVSKARSASVNSNDKNENYNPTPISSNGSQYRSLEKIDSNSTSSISDHELQLDQLEETNRDELNKPIIQYLEQIAKKLKKRGQPRQEDMDSNQTIELEDIENSKELKRLTTKTNKSSRVIIQLKESIKAIDNELQHQSEQMSFINQKFSASHHAHYYGLNQWGTYSASRQSIDSDPYFIALNLFKSHIRELKGTLLNRKKFY